MFVRCAYSSSWRYRRMGVYFSCSLLAPFVRLLCENSCKRGRTRADRAIGGYRRGCLLSHADTAALRYRRALPRHAVDLCSFLSCFAVLSDRPTLNTLGISILLTSRSCKALSMSCIRTGSTTHQGNTKLFSAQDVWQSSLVVTAKTYRLTFSGTSKTKETSLHACTAGEMLAGSLLPWLLI